jgi:hypothetical protein
VWIEQVKYRTEGGKRRIGGQAERKDGGDGKQGQAWGQSIHDDDGHDVRRGWWGVAVPGAKMCRPGCISMASQCTEGGLCRRQLFKLADQDPPYTVFRPYVARSQLSRRVDASHCPPPPSSRGELHIALMAVDRIPPATASLLTHAAPVERCREADSEAYSTVVQIVPGIHQYKFIVDGEWRCAADQPR